MTRTAEGTAQPIAEGCPSWCIVDHAAEESPSVAGNREGWFHLGRKITVDGGHGHVVTVQLRLIDGGDVSLYIDGAIGNRFTWDGARRFAVAVLEALDQVGAL
jgi:hypothetical protein